jgi:hypothetical protein
MLFYILFTKKMLDYYRYSGTSHEYFDNMINH